MAARVRLRDRPPSRPQVQGPPRHAAVRERCAPGQRGAPAAHRRVVGTDREARQAQRPEYRGNVLGTSCLRAEARGEQDAHAPSRGQSANPCRSLLLLIVLRGRNSTVARTTESAATCVHARTRIRAHGTKAGELLGEGGLFPFPQRALFFVVAEKQQQHEEEEEEEEEKATSHQQSTKKSRFWGAQARRRRVGGGA